jgi:hypothetical protein
MQENDASLPTYSPCYMYQVYVSGIVEPLLFLDDEPFPVIQNQWLTKRQILDRLDHDYEAAMESYGAAMDKADTLGDGAGPLPERPAKSTLTEELLLTFKGNKDGKLGGSIFVGSVIGLRLMDATGA